MNALFFCFLASIFSALGNLLFRINAAKGSGVDNSKSYLFVFYLVSFIFSLVLNPQVLSTAPKFSMLLIGAMVGVINVSLMFITSKALAKGPAGLTFAFQSASAVFPGLLLFSIFGAPYGFSFTLMQFFGVSLVLLGLFAGTQRSSSDGKKASVQWLKYALALFCVQVMALSLIQGRCVLFDCEKVGGFLAQFSLSQADDIWFMPGQFGISLLLQGAILINEKKPIQRNSLFFGVLGGATFFACTYLLLLSTKIALPREKAILFPFSAVSTIILCNLWARQIYKEKFNFLSNGLCASGIFLAV